MTDSGANQHGRPGSGGALGTISRVQSSHGRRGCGRPDGERGGAKWFAIGLRGEQLCDPCLQALAPDTILSGSYRSSSATSTAGHEAPPRPGSAIGIVIVEEILGVPDMGGVLIPPNANKRQVIRLRMAIIGG